MKDKDLTNSKNDLKSCHYGDSFFIVFYSWLCFSMENEYETISYLFFEINSIIKLCCSIDF